MALTSPRHTGRVPSRVSQRLLVDPIAAELDNTVHRAVFETLEAALGWIDDYPVTRDPGTGSNAWTVELAPGVHDFPAGLVAADGVTIMADASAGNFSAGADVILRCDATSGDLLSLGIGGNLIGVHIQVRAADATAGNTITGPVSAVVIPAATTEAGNLIQDVTFEAQVNGAGNDAHPIILLDHRNATTNVPFNMQRCHLYQKVVGLTPHADSRLLKAVAFGQAYRAPIEQCRFERPPNSAALAVAVEFTTSVKALFRRCWFPGWPVGSYVLQQAGGTSLSTFKHCEIPADAGTNKLGGQITNDDFGTSPWEATDPGVKYEVRFEREGTDLHVYSHDGTGWLRHTLPLTTWVRP